MNWIANRDRSLIVNAETFDRCSIEPWGENWAIIFTRAIAASYVTLDVFETKEAAERYFCDVVMRKLGE